MIRDFLHARRYLAPTLDSFWVWSDGGDVLTLRSGNTIAFRAEVVEVLRPLVPHGFPHFDAIVLFLAACRSASQIGEREIEIHRVLPSLTDSERRNWRYRDLLVALEAVGSISSEVRCTLAGKKELAAMLFETAYIAEPEESAAAILHALERGLPREMYGARHSRTAGEPDMLSRLAPLAAGAHRVAPDRLDLRRKTGLEQLPEPEPVDSSPPESLRALLERLKTDEELGGLARLARSLLAALTLPRAVSEHEDLPLGGVSDITNRGPFDRLLVSELAHDDLTFTVRVALNEALYLRREAPPHVPPRRRVVLIDCGLRMWGLPRVFATAAAMALAVSRNPNADTKVYRPRGPHLDVVDLATREGLVKHLAALEPESHPGESLAVFRRLVNDEANDEKAVNEAVLITCDEVLEDKVFQQRLAESELPALYLLSVSRSGQLRMARRGPSGTKVLREIRCSLDDILAPRKEITPLRDNKCDPALPAILRIQPFPLRLTHPIDPQRLWGDADSGGLYVTTDKRLMYWDKRGQGARQISDTIPAGKLLWHDSGAAAQTMSTAVIGRLMPGELHILHVDRESGVYIAHSILLRARNPRGVAVHAGALFVIFADQIEVYSLGDGQWIDTRGVPASMRWLRDRFFASPEGWYALSFNGTTAQFEQVCDATTRPELALISLFDSVGVDGPAGVTSRGEICRIEMRSNPLLSRGKHLWTHVLNAGRLPPGGPFRVAAIAADGQRIILSPLTRSAGRPSNWLIDLRAVDPVLSYSEPATALAANLVGAISNRTLRNKFMSIFVDGTVLVLEAKKSRNLCRIEWDSSNRRIHMKIVLAKSEGQRKSFTETPGPQWTGYKLSVAEWDDGSRAYLDSRGLLHLKSSDPTIPELTLVLCDGTMAGWCADGRMFGPAYFTGIPIADDFEHRIRALATAGHKIEAIKLYREQKGVGLGEAKEAIECFDPEAPGGADCDAAFIYNEVLKRFVMRLR